MKYILICILTYSLFACQEQASVQQERLKLPEQSQFFWDNLNALCGNTYRGEVIRVPLTDSSFFNKRLLLHFIACDSGTVKAAFHVGDNKSRVLIINNLGKSLELVHQHTNEDGKLAERNYYGGISNNHGLYNCQFFPASQKTAEMIPFAAANIWWLELEPAKHFIYNLKRLGTDREFSFAFDLTRPANTPGVPWGWER